MGAKGHPRHGPWVSQLIGLTHLRVIRKLFIFIFVVR
jgi:hypothetical protein